MSKNILFIHMFTISMSHIFLLLCMLAIFYCMPDIMGKKTVETEVNIYPQKIIHLFFCQTLEWEHE